MIDKTKLTKNIHDKYLELYRPLLTKEAFQVSTSECTLPLYLSPRFLCDIADDPIETLHVKTRFLQNHMCNCELCVETKNEVLGYIKKRCDTLTKELLNKGATIIVSDVDQDSTTQLKKQVETAIKQPHDEISDDPILNPNLRETTARELVRDGAKPSFLDPRDEDKFGTKH